MNVLIAAFLLMFSGALFAANPPLCDEITLDPLGRSYGSMTAEQVAADINSEYRNRFLQRIAGADLFEGIEGADWVLLSEADRTLVLQILSLGDVNPQGNARTLLVGIFGGGSQTISNMAALATETVTRADELQLGRVRVGDIVACRAGG